MKFKVFFGLFLFFLLLLWGGEKVRFGHGQWLEDHHPQKKAQDFFDDYFSKGEGLTIAIELQDSFYRQEVVDSLRALTVKLKKEEVLSSFLTPISALLSLKVSLKGEESVELLSFDKALQEGKIDLFSFKEEFEKGPYAKKLIDQKGKNFLLQATYDIPEDFHERKRILSFVKKTLEDFPLFSSYRLAGGLRTFYEMDESTRKDLWKVLLVSFFLLFWGLFFFYRKISITVMALTPSVFCLLVTLNVFSFLGHKLTSVNTVLLALITIISLTDTVHIFERFSSCRNLFKTMRQMWAPCLATSLSTGIGFGSVVLSEILPLKEMGQASLLVIPLAYGFTLGLNWLLLASFGGNVNSPQIFSSSFFENFSKKLFSFLQENRRWKKGFILFFIVLGVGSFTQLTTKMNFLDLFFKKQVLSIEILPGLIKTSQEQVL